MATRAPLEQRRYEPSLRRRFWGSVPIGKPDDCWHWSGGRNGGGYGTITERGRSYLATRLMLQFVAGEPVPQAMLVCHTCDNPQCVNPKHLWVGTHRMNALDMIAKGRRCSRPLRANCGRGHAFTNDNIIVESGKRRCRICRARRNRRGGQNG